MGLKIFQTGIKDERFAGKLNYHFKQKSKKDLTPDQKVTG
jgi:hypothetical protein